jgi:hypothetical protein
MARLTREQVLARKLGQEEVDLGDGDTVMVRGLNRDQAHHLQTLEVIREREVYMIAVGMADPEMTEEDVAAWFAGDEAGALDKIAKVITRLSGMADGQGKDATKSVPRRRGRGRA